MAVRKAVFFTIDSLLASGIVIIAVILVSNFYAVERQKANIDYASQDLVRVFSTMTVGQVNNAYVKSLISDSSITNTNNTILEQIGDFWAGGNTELARNFTKNLTEDIIPTDYGFSILVNDEEIYSRNIPLKKALVSSRKIISGIAKAKPTEGFTARALLSGIKSKKTNSYVYFGGYEGDGNLTKRWILPNDVISFNSSYLEVDAGGSFDLYINGFFSGSYAKGSSGGGNMLADKWNISNAYLPNFRAGENVISINFTSGISYIAGGFLRVTYVTSSFNDTQISGYEKHMLPGIDGTINLYSSVYVPGSLNNMLVFLNYTSNYTLFLKMGNTTIYENNTNGTMAGIKLTNSTLKSLLDYNMLNQKTIPLRIGLKDAFVLKKGNADVALITDVSGSMDWRLDSSSTGVSRNCSDPLLYDPSTKRISLAKCLDRQFIDTLLNSSLGNTTNMIGLIAYSGIPNFMGTSNSVIISSTHNLSNDNVSLKNQIDSYSPGGATGICGSIRQARTILEQQSNSSRQKFIVVMTDDVANVQCSISNEYSTTGCIPYTCPDNSFCGGGGCLYQQCGDWISDRASNDSVDASCRAYNTTNAVVYAIGFGPVSACPLSNQTLKSIADCGKGAYYLSSDAVELSNIYNTIAQRIINLSFAQQTADLGASLNTKLFSDSYIEFNFTPTETPFNKIPLGLETDRFGNNISSGILTIYENTSVLDARVTSYSGARWTDKLVINGNTAYRLADYGNDYTILGDPFAVNIPTGSISQGSNSITISTGTNLTNPTGGSGDNRVVYTLLLNGFADYSSVTSKSDGCSWTVSFEDGTAATIKVPSSYSGADICTFSGKIYDANDALDNAVYQLFGNLDIDKDGKLDISVDENNLNVNALTISKVPSLWGPAIIEIRVWE